MGEYASALPRRLATGGVFRSRTVSGSASFPELLPHFVFVVACSIRSNLGKACNWNVAVFSSHIGGHCPALVWRSSSLIFRVRVGCRSWIARREFSKLDRNLCRAMAPFVAVVAVSGLVNNEGYKVLPYLLRVSELSVCLVISEQVFRTSSDRRSMIWTLVAAALFYGVVGLLQIPIAFRGRVYSFFENPNQLAGYLNLLLPFFASLFLASRGRRIRLLWGYLIVGVVITAAATLSRAGMLSTLFALGCVWLFFFKNNCKGWRSEPWTSLTRFLRSSIRSFALHTGILVLLFLVLLFMRPLFE